MTPAQPPHAADDPPWSGHPGTPPGTLHGRRLGRTVILSFDPLHRHHAMTLFRATALPIPFILNCRVWDVVMAEG